MRLRLRLLPSVWRWLWLLLLLLSRRCERTRIAPPETFGGRSMDVRLTD